MTKRTVRRHRASEKAPRGRQQAPRVGDRLAKTQIALRARIDRGIVAKYLAIEGAPKPDAAGRFSYRAVLAWIEKNAPRAGSSENTERMRTKRERLLDIELAEAEHDLAVKQGRYVDKAQIKPAFANFCLQLTEDMRTKFEHELPSKYEGKSTVERQQLNVAAIDWVLRRLREGAASITQ